MPITKRLVLVRLEFICYLSIVIWDFEFIHPPALFTSLTAREKNINV